MLIRANTCLEYIHYLYCSHVTHLSSSQYTNMHISEKMSVHTHVRALRQFMRCLLKVRLYILAGIFALCIVFMMQHHKDFLSPLSSVREDVEPHKQYGSNEGWTVRTRARYERDEERKARRFERRVAQEWVHQSARGPTW